MTSFSSELFSAGARDAEKIFAAADFPMTRLEPNDAFGSHYAEYRNGADYFRLLWDGKEQWLQLVTGSEGIAEQEVFFRWMRGGTEADYKSAMHDALHTMQNYFSSSHVHDDDDGGCCGHHHA